MVYDIEIDGRIYSIDYFNHANHPVNARRINIFASGPSIETQRFDEDTLNYATIFVNGSIKLTSQYIFSNTVGYVITDPRFISHQPRLLSQSYAGQPLFATSDVVSAIARLLPDLFIKYQDNMTIIYPVDRPPSAKQGKSIRRGWLTKLPFISTKIISAKKIGLVELESDPDFVIASTHSSQPIGVSLNLSRGFVEAGTVAYVATQLAYSLGSREIHLYGVDLINSNLPRFYESTENKAPSKLDKAVENRIIPSFDLLARTYHKLDTSVFNHSSVSKSLFQDILYLDD